MAERVVVVGSTNVDHTVRVDRFPRPGETLLASSLTNSVGGKGANQAVAAAKSGALVSIVASVGDDVEGDLALDTLTSAGVDTSGVRRVPHTPTGSAWITVSSTDNTILVVPGANHHWTEHLPQFRRSDLVLCQLEIPIPVVEDIAGAATGTFLLNAAPAAQLSNELLGRCDVLIVNEHELAETSGSAEIDASDHTTIVAASQSLISRGTRGVVTTLGGRGAVLCTAETTYLAGAPPTPIVVDSTGAGDAFCGVFAARLAAGAALPEALRFAVTAGSFAVRQPTAQGGYDDFARLDALVEQTPDIRTEAST